MPRASVLTILPLAWTLAGGSSGVALALPMFDLSIDTSVLSGASAHLAFDLVSGNAASNVLTIRSFSSDGVLGAPASTGGPITGVLPGVVTIADGGFFNELLQPMTLGTRISFRLELTQNVATGSPDEFSLFLLDASGALPLFPTTDPTGASASFVVDITADPFGSFHVFGPAIGPPAPILTVVPVSEQVPEPPPATLIAIGLIALVAVRRGTARTTGYLSGPRDADAIGAASGRAVSRPGSRRAGRPSAGGTRRLPPG